MKYKFSFFFVLLFAVIVSYAHVTLPRLISNGMVLQRNAKTNIWGWAAPGEDVTLTFNKANYKTVTSQDGKWLITLPPQKGGGPYEMVIKGSNTITLSNILFGEVWLCSGQSNMELTMARLKYKYAAVVATANHTNIRQFEVPDVYNFNAPAKDFTRGKWLTATSDDILQFSAVAYFFALDIYNKYKVPVGIINAALGGSPAEAWISESALQQFPDYLKEMQKYKDSSLIMQTEAHDREVSHRWYNELYAKDEGVTNHWSDPSFNDAGWPTMNLPGYWAESPLGAVNGAVWFRKKIEVPPSFTGKNTTLILGRIVDADSVFVNGKLVGSTGYQYPPRIYDIPPGLLQTGSNEVVVKVISNSGKGGFVRGKTYALVAGGDTLQIAGEWKYQLGATMQPLPGQTFIRWKPGGLFNGMIAPLLNYAIKGVLWYQGESNAGHPQDYTQLMQTLITDWRSRWKKGAFPFLTVQLANFMEAEQTPGESDWAQLRQAQLNTLSLPNTGMAVAIDAGEWNDIHPLNKEAVGKRLALLAQHIAYGENNVVYSGPTLASVAAKGNKLILSFTNRGSGLVAKEGDSLHYFSIAGADKKFVWATAQIQDGKIVVWNDTIANPVYVRYAWANNPEGANLYNREGLPASPFEARIH